MLQDTEKWLAALQKSIRDQNSSALASDDMQDRIREAVQGHFYILAQAFADVDFAGIGAVTKDDFKTILTKNVMRPTDEQVIVVFLPMSIILVIFEFILKLNLLTVLNCFIVQLNLNPHFILSWVFWHIKNYTIWQKNKNKQMQTILIFSNLMKKV